jgi:lipid-A-disaccharide synthase
MASLPAKPLSLMLVCGEPSGDRLGGQLMAAFKSILGAGVTFCGIGGEAMAAQGLKSLYPLDATAVMGLREVVPKIPAILARVREAADFAAATKPDAVILIDSPDFTHRVAARIKEIAPRLPTIDYVAPQLWASRSYRAKKMARNFDLVLALLPFEPPFFEAYGLRCIFVGHPAIERAALMKGGDDFRARHGIAPDAPLLAVLPGSRTNEIRFIFPIFREAVRAIAERVPGLVTVLPTVAHVAARVRAGAEDWPTQIHIVEGDDEKFAAFDAADAALAASGTVTTELALAKTPMVVAYKVGWLTSLLMKPFVHFKFATIVNLLLDREAVPEFLQERCLAGPIADAATALLTDKAAAARQTADLEEAMRRLGQGGEAPSLRAARAVLAYLKR